MIILGLILIVLGALVPKLAVMFTIGCFVLLVGVILAVAGASGHAVGGRRWY